MAPPRKHDTDDILDAARTLVLRDGPRAASVAAIAEESGAPVGTLYHRFGNRDGVLTAAWLRALERFQDRALAATTQSDPLDAAVALAMTQVRFAREEADDVRLLLAIRRRDLLDAAPDDAFRDRLATMNAPLQAALARLTRALRGRADARSLDAVVRAVVDLPNAAVRRHLREGGRLPGWLERDVADAVRTLLLS
ncbi:MAG: TetR/AcrR family transcriptional regulator [Jatrophihabitans sp.]|uniref:TetR/AcrR family transcriptional regulator n=1 Tax=Jatrophihabitans sp. TaxID=1932789 RepID=UPI00390EBEDE